MDKVIAVKNHEKIVSVGCGKWCFAVVDDNHLETQEVMEHFYKQSNKELYQKYMDVFELCVMAWLLRMICMIFVRIIKN